MLSKLDRENSKQYQAICDYWRLGPSRSLSQLLTLYKESDNAPAKTYVTLVKWASEFDWDNRIAQNIQIEQTQLEEMYKVELVKNYKRRFDVLDSMYDLLKDVQIDTEEVSIGQVTTLYKTLLDGIGRTFNLDAPQKIAPTDPSGKTEYGSANISELLKLADAAKRRPTE